MKTAVYIALISMVFQFSALQAQHKGCTDPRAVNFDLFAHQNDGSCRYRRVVLTPEFAFELPQEVRETSGLVFYNNRLWTHNDSGHLPVLYALDTASAEILQRVTISNAVNRDWEEITADDTYLYIGDFGNNRGTREDLVIYRIRLDALPESGDATIEAEIIAFSYPDQTGFYASREHNFDCEAFIAVNDSLYLFSKNRGDQQTKLYRLPAIPGEYVAEWLDTFNSRGLITGSAYHAEANEIVLIGYVNQVWTPFVWTLWDFNGNDFFSGNKRRIDFVNLVTTQTEGICYVNSKELLISAEESPTFSARVFRFSTATYTDHIGFDFMGLQGRSHLMVLHDHLQEKLLQLHVKNPGRDAARVDILNHRGEIVKSETYKFDSRSDLWLQMNLHELPTGSYKVVFITGKQVLTSSFDLP